MDSSTEALLTVSMFVGILASLAAVAVAFICAITLTVVAATKCGLISPVRLHNAITHRVQKGTGACWVGIGVGSGLTFGVLSWWMLSPVASAEFALARILAASSAGIIVGFVAALGSIHLGRKFLAQLPTPAAPNSPSAVAPSSNPPLTFPAFQRRSLPLTPSSPDRILKNG